MIIGKRISGRYKIKDMIGGGGMANVYLAHDMILDRDVAVKMLRLDFANDDEFIRRFHREAQSATSLAHPNIVSIYDVGEEDGLYYIVMEYVDGQTLKQYIQQHAPVPVEEALGIMKQLTSAISHAHQNHIVHRDIKPHNILIDSDGTVKITDFGIAMALSATSITQTNSVLGSVHYLSPEQARGGMANKKSDIYSIGIVMFELLTGRLPFSGESAVSIALKHLQSETPSLKRWNPQIPQSVENVVLKATAKDPFHRYDTVDEMEEDLNTALDAKRLNEGKFVIPEDDEATKAIPIITNDRPYHHLDETIVRKDAPDSTDAPKAKPEKKKKKKWPIILTVLFLLILTAGILMVTIGPDIFGPKEKEVPDVSGMEVEDAVAELMSAGFFIGDRKEISDEEVEEGNVIRTNPKAGKMIKEGNKIDLYISTGKETLELSDYTDRNYDDVYKLLEGKGFKDIKKTEVHDDSEAGTILDQNPSGGESVIPEETTLEFTVSKGPEMVTLRDLKGYNQDNLDVYEETTGLVIERTEESYHDTIEAGYVISQKPEAGTEMKPGSTVSVVISKGKELVPKRVKHVIRVPYEPSEEGVPQQIQIFYSDLEHPEDMVPEDTFEITEDTEREYEFNIPPNDEAYYRVVRDGKVIEENTVPYPQD
jgi:eukaryotic-like serine/threonine-protein kinase